MKWKNKKIFYKSFQLDQLEFTSLHSFDAMFMLYVHLYSIISIYLVKNVWNQDEDIVLLVFCNNQFQSSLSPIFAFFDPNKTKKFYFWN